MIKWFVRLLGVELSIDVTDCITQKEIQFKAIRDYPGVVANLKERLIGASLPRYGKLEEDFLVNGSELAHVVQVGLADFDPILIEGEEIYAAHKPEPFPDGVKI